MISMSRHTKFRISTAILAGCAAAGTLGFSESAHALPLIDLGASARLMYSSPIEDLQVNPYGLGLGLRGGITIPGNLYLGVNAELYFGEKDDILAETANRIEAELVGLGDEARVARSSFVTMAEVGYDFSLVALTIRPLVGFGLLGETIETCPADGDCTEESNSRFGISPGIQVLALPGFIKLTAEARYLSALGEGDVASLTFGGGLALEF